MTPLYDGQSSAQWHSGLSYVQAIAGTRDVTTRCTADSSRASADACRGCNGGGDGVWQGDAGSVYEHP